MSRLLISCKTQRAPFKTLLKLMFYVSAICAVSLDLATKPLDPRHSFEPASPLGSPPRLVRRTKSQPDLESAPPIPGSELFQHQIGNTFLSNMAEREAESREKAWKYQDMGERWFAKGEKQLRMLEVVKSEVIPPELTYWREDQARRIRRHKVKSNWRKAAARGFNRQAIAHHKHADSAAEAQESALAAGWRLGASLPKLPADTKHLGYGKQPVLGHLRGIPNTGTVLRWPKPGRGLHVIRH